MKHHRRGRLRLLNFFKEAGRTTPVRQREAGQHDVKVFVAKTPQGVQHASNPGDRKALRIQHVSGLVSGDP
jgi:hypothetical protein